MKKLEFYIPGINLSDVDHDKLAVFAEKHNDQYAVNIADNPDLEKDLQMTFIRVVKHETGIRFHMLETEDGNFAVYLPDAWHPMPYDQLFEAVMPYVHELFLPYQWNFENVMTFISYDEEA